MLGTETGSEIRQPLGYAMAGGGSRSSSGGVAGTSETQGACNFGNSDGAVSNLVN
jgi:hypothetical protein